MKIKKNKYSFPKEVKSDYDLISSDIINKFENEMFKLQLEARVKALEICNDLIKDPKKIFWIYMIKLIFQIYRMILF